MKRAVLAFMAVALSAGLEIDFAEATPPSSMDDGAIDKLIARMTLTEKVSQLQSTAPAIKHLGIAAYDWWSEGLHGIAREGEATVFPQAIGLAASFDPELLQSIGRNTAEEAREKFEESGWHADHARFQGLTIWSPNVNIFRDPRWGRGQETYGEDPYLSGTLGAAYITGLQGPDPEHPIAAASVKHFVAHSGPEDGRYGMDMDVAPADLTQTYEPAFQAAVAAGVSGIMCSYNATHGTPNCASTSLLRDTLRSTWGFGGHVVADCDAVMEIARFHHAAPTMAQAAAMALNAGVDLDCGTAYGALTEAVHEGLISEKTLNLSLHRLFALRAHLGWTPGTGATPIGPYPRSTRSPERHALALRAATESMVLLSNPHHTLPLPSQAQLAMVGPDCDAPTVMEANYHGTASAILTPLTALSTRFGPIRYAQGSAIATGVPITIPFTALTSPNGEAGLVGQYQTLSTGSALTRTDRIVDMDWDHVPPIRGISSEHYTVSWSGTLTVPTGGARPALAIDRCFDCGGHDTAELTIDGHQRVVLGANDEALTVAGDTLSPGPHQIRLTYVHSGEDQGIHLRWIADPKAQRDEAVRAIKDADVVLACVGLAPEVEGEALQVQAPGFVGGDRTNISLPAAQQSLLNAAFASGKPVVVLSFGGGAIAFGDVTHKAAALMQLWYPGEAGAEALTRVLTGDDTPSGRLPVTFYHATEDLMPFADYDMKDVLGGRTYRYFTGKPDFPFGYGLGYGDIVFGKTKINGTTATAQVSNRGTKPDVAVAELYVLPPAGEDRPNHNLVGIMRQPLAPGESRTIAFPIPEKIFSYADATGTLRVIPGAYHLLIAARSPSSERIPNEAAALSVPASASAAEKIRP